MPSVSFNDQPSPGEDYFNDLSQQPTNSSSDQQQQQRRESGGGSGSGGGGEEGGNDQIPKTKRIACVLCRKRKLRCDGGKPSCGTCVRLQHDCSYDEVRRKSGPKRGYVKALEARLVQVEAMLKTQDDVPAQQQQQQQQQNDGSNQSGNSQTDNQNMTGVEDNVISISPPQMNPTAGPVPTDFSNVIGENDGSNMRSTEPFPWEMIGLGLDEPLPVPEVVEDLTQIYFEKTHPSAPMIHRPRYYAAMNLAPHLRPPVCLRYAMWANAAAVSDKYEALHEHFYVRARKYIQQDEMKGHGENMITIAHCQTWILLATYEFKLMYFPRAWMSSGRACRMSQMMGLHRLDGKGLDVKQCLAPSRDWTEREERRRTFWMAFNIDRYSSIGTGWPMTIEERDISTDLPSDEENYDLSRQVVTPSLEDALGPEGVGDLGSFAGVAVMACLFGRNLNHLHRPSPDDNDQDLNGDFWRRHRAMDNILLNTALALPDPLRLPAGLNNSNVVWLNMAMHTSTICLHQAAIFKADQNHLPANISAESKVRCITAAAEIASIMRQVSHLDLSSMNPFVAFCLYVAARVFVQFLKSRPNDSQRKASLQFLLSAMHAIKRKNPLTESFLVQLDVDLVGAGLEDTRTLRAAANRNNSFRSDKVPHFIRVNDDGDQVSCEHIFGDGGAALYNNPNAHPPSLGGSPTPNNPTPAPPPPPGLMNFSDLPIDNNMGFVSANQSRFDLPMRTPGSHPSSTANVQEMDISPDSGGVGPGDHTTPGSGSGSGSAHNNYSSHTSNTAYSPPVNYQHSSQHQHQQQHHHHQHQQQQQQQHRQNSEPALHNSPLTNLYAGGNAAFSDFDLSVCASDRQQQRLGSGSGSGSGASAFTPGAANAAGFTPGNSSGVVTGPGSGASGGMNDLMNLSEADWNQVLQLGGYDIEWENSAMVEGGKGGGLLY